jgi:hypothetical protein
VDLLILRGKQICLVLVPKWCLACEGWIRVLGTQLLDPVVELYSKVLKYPTGYFIYFITFEWAK